jgi:transposase-like protein
MLACPALSPAISARRRRALASGLRAAEIEPHTGVDATTIRRWRHRAERGAALAPRHAPGRGR